MFDGVFVHTIETFLGVSSAMNFGSYPEAESLIGHELQSNSDFSIILCVRTSNLCLKSILFPHMYLQSESQFDGNICLCKEAVVCERMSVQRDVIRRMFVQVHAVMRIFVLGSVVMRIFICTRVCSNANICPGGDAVMRIFVQGNAVMRRFCGNTCVSAM